MQPACIDEYKYVLFVDEAGDDGLKRVRPIDEIGGTEWLCISGLLIRADNEDHAVRWVREIRADISANQGPVLHFKKLSPTKKQRTCELLAQYPVVGFIVCSNKKNMRGWKNSKAASSNSKQWFYNYCVRLLMERVTAFCAKDSLSRYGTKKPLKVIFSERGGHYYGQTKAYWLHLKSQQAAGTTYLNKREIDFDLIRYRLVDYVPHTQLAGLQLADVLASSFYLACDVLDVKNDPFPAQLLQLRMAREEGSARDFGVVLQPTPTRRAELLPEQQVIFKHSGYRF